MGGGLSRENDEEGTVPHPDGVSDFHSIGNGCNCSSLMFITILMPRRLKHLLGTLCNIKVTFGSSSTLSRIMSVISLSKWTAEDSSANLRRLKINRGAKRHGRCDAGSRGKAKAGPHGLATKPCHANSLGLGCKRPGHPLRIFYTVCCLRSGIEVLPTPYRSGSESH